MARERIELVVDGIPYSYCTISPTQAGLIFLKLTRIFGPLIGTMVGGDGIPSKEDVKKMGDQFKDIEYEKMFEIAADRMEEEAIMKMAKKLLSNTYPEAREGAAVQGPMHTLGKDSSFDTHFDSTPGILHMFKVVKEVLWLQYADFFEGLGFLGSAKPKEPKAIIESPMVP